MANLNNLIKSFQTQKDYELEAVIDCASLFDNLSVGEENDTRGVEEVCNGFTKLMHHYHENDTLPPFEYILDVYYVQPQNQLEQPIRARYTTRTKHPQICQKKKISRVFGTFYSDKATLERFSKKRRKTVVSAQESDRAEKIDGDSIIIFGEATAPRANAKNFVVNLKHEKQMKKNFLGKQGNLWIPSFVRLQQRWSYFNRKNNIRLDFTKVAEGKTKEDACKSTPKFIIEVEAIRLPNQKNSLQEDFVETLQKLLCLSLEVK